MFGVREGVSGSLLSEGLHFPPEKDGNEVLPLLYTVLLGEGQ